MSALDVASRLAVVGAGAGLSNGPIITRAMSLAPQQLMGTVGASSSLSRNAGFAVGPALAIGAWAAPGSELAGMRVGTVAAAAVVFGAVALVGRRRAVAHRDRTDDASTPATSAPE